MSQDKAQNVPAISNTAAAMLSGGLITLVSAWEGAIPYFGEGDFSAIKTYILPIIPSLGMILAFWFKALGYRYSLGLNYRKLIKLNKNKIKKVKAALKDKDLTHEDRLKFQKQLGQYHQDGIDIDSKKFQFASASATRAEEDLTRLQASDPYANQEASSLIKQETSRPES
ncbi:hypothetical protein [Photobacterium salinisoli]|uniref:hypothetical protein n=1 Tax=Photobacterium salinisoli TaxID=1616783 RepID=UPI000EA02742|nr:hypothetical protein [Photobacterium salinisoli]